MHASFFINQRLSTLMPNNYGIVSTLRSAEPRQQPIGRATVQVSSDEHGMGVTLMQGEETLHIQLDADASDDEILHLGSAVLNFLRREPVPGYRILDLVGGYVYDCNTGDTRYI